MSVLTGLQNRRMSGVLISLQWHGTFYSLSATVPNAIRLFTKLVSLKKHSDHPQTDWATDGIIPFDTTFALEGGIGPDKLVSTLYCNPDPPSSDDSPTLRSSPLRFKQALFNSIVTTRLLAQCLRLELDLRSAIGPATPKTPRLIRTDDLLHEIYWNLTYMLSRNIYDPHGRAPAPKLPEGWGADDGLQENRQFAHFCGFVSAMWRDKKVWLMTLVVEQLREWIRQEMVPRVRSIGDFTQTVAVHLESGKEEQNRLGDTQDTTRTQTAASHDSNNLATDMPGPSGHAIDDTFKNEQIEQLNNEIQRSLRTEKGFLIQDGEYKVRAPH